MDQDLWFKATHFHGPLLLQTILSGESDSIDEVESDKLRMCQFIKKNLPLLLKPCDYSSDDLPGYSIPTVPIEIFQTSSPVDKRDIFFKSLDRGNILILQIINDTLPDNFKLLVVCREDNCMKLDDLSLIMYLPKHKAELDLAGGELQSRDLIRAAVCSCSIDERKLYVTLDSNILDDEAEHIKLGKISEQDLPFYIRSSDCGSSLVEYLHQKPEFINPTWSKELYSFLDIKKNYLYSFFDNFDGVTYPAAVCASELKKKHAVAISKAKHTKAREFYEVGNFTDAFIYLNDALRFHPKNVEALVTRGVLYANTNNITSAYADLEAALKIDPKYEEGRKQMSVLLVSIARMHIELNDIDKAQESVDAALNTDNNNKDAVSVIEEIRKIRALAGNLKSDKKTRIGSSSSDRSDSSSSRLSDFKEKQSFFLEASTRALLSSLKKKHGRKHHHHKTHHKSRSKSPKRKSLPSSDH